MSEENKKKIREMGFGGILDLKVGKIPGKFAYHVVSQFDANTMELKVNNKSIKITEETVKELMDLPRGENKIPLDEKATKDKSSIEEWRMQFNVPTDASKILLSVVVSKLKRQKRPSLNFMRNWLVVMVNSLIQSGPNNYANQRILGTIENPEDAKNYNWCEYILESLKMAKGKINNYNFLGPTFFLMVSIFHYIYV